MSMVAYWVKIACIDEIQTLGPLARDRFLAKLRDIDAEADEVYREACRRWMSRPGTGDEDPSDGEESAQAAAQERYNALFSLRHAALNLLAAWLYHLFEQQVQSYEKRNSYSGERYAKLFPLEAGSKVEELRLVANAVKHGDRLSRGYDETSVEKLRAIRSDMFEHPYLAKKGIKFVSTTTTPFAGDGLYVSEEDLIAYEQAIVSLWEEVMELHSNPRKTAAPVADSVAAKDTETP
jgi:hypothetical protein